MTTQEETRPPSETALDRLNGGSLCNARQDCFVLHSPHPGKQQSVKINRQEETKKKTTALNGCLSLNQQKKCITRRLRVRTGFATDRRRSVAQTFEGHSALPLERAVGVGAALTRLPANTRQTTERPRDSIGPLEWSASPAKRQNHTAMYYHWSVPCN